MIDQFCLAFYFASGANYALLFGQFAMLILALSIHEFGHAWTAHSLGDDTAKRLGRVTLNPIPHLDPIFSVVLPLVMIFSGTGIFGAGKPVPVNPHNLRREHWDFLLISVAGPAMNVVLALILVGLYHALIEFGEMDYLGLMGRLLFFGIGLNILLAVLNMIPVPPLDGHRVLGIVLPEVLRKPFYRAPWLGLILFVYLIWGGGFQLMYKHALQPIGVMMAHIMPYNMSPFD